MAGGKTYVSNFSHPAVHDEQLARLGALAEHYFPEDPNTCLLELRHFGELMAQDIAARFGEYTSPEEKQADLLRRLQARRAIPCEVGDLFYQIPVRPIEEQAEIVRRVDSLFSVTDELDAGVNSARARVEKIAQSLLAKAFRGELPRPPGSPLEAEFAVEIEETVA